MTLSYAAALSKDLSLTAGLIHYAWYLAADLTASLGYNGGQWLDEGGDPGFSDLNFALTLPLQSGRFQIAAFANYTIVLLDAIGEDNHFWFGISLSYSGIY